MVVTFVNLTQSRIIWEKYLSGELFILVWSVRNALNWCGKTHALIVAPFPRMDILNWVRNWAEADMHSFSLPLNTSVTIGCKFVLPSFPEKLSCNLELWAKINIFSLNLFCQGRKRKTAEDLSCTPLSISSLQSLNYLSISCWRRQCRRVIKSTSLWKILVRM